MDIKTQVRRIGDRIGGYGVVFGDPMHKDLEGDYFTPETEFWLDTYRNQPVLYDHALGSLPPGFYDIPPSGLVFGQVVKVVPDEIGLWIEAQITEHNEWVEAVLELIDRGVLHWSSGSAPHLVKRDPDGRIISWPIIEWSATPTPAEPRQTNVVRLKHFVQFQDAGSGAPGAQADEAARALSDRPVSLSHADLSNGVRKMKRDKKTARALVWAYANANAPEILTALKGIKQEEYFEEEMPSEGPAEKKSPRSPIRTTSSLRPCARWLKSWRRWPARASKTP